MDKNVKSLYEIFSANSSVFIEQSDVIEITPQNLGTVKEKLKELDIQSEVIQNTKIRVPLLQRDLIIFWDEVSYQTRARPKDFLNNILIVNKLTPYYYKKDTGETFVKFELIVNDFLFDNAINYFKFLDFLKSQEHREDGLFYFVDHFNQDTRSIIFTSLNRQGKLVIPYGKEIPTFDRRVSIKKRVVKLVDSFDPQNRHLPKFIKHQLFEFLSKEPRDQRLTLFIEKLNEIIEKAEQDHEIYMSELTLQNLKKEYLEHKEKYFLQFREVLGKITAQVIGLPLSVTAASFATYKVESSISTLIFILIAFSIYSIYMLFLVKLHKEDIGDIKENSIRDYKALVKGIFFTKYPKELVPFQIIKDKMDNRAKVLNRFIIVYYLALLITSSAFVGFIAVQLKTALLAVILICAGLIVIGLIYLQYDVKETKK